MTTKTMRFSTRSTYGLRALCELADHAGQGPLSVAAIARKEQISLSYLEQLLNRLRKQGLVRSVRGPKGGYLLARDAHAISLAEIVQALEGDAVTPDETNGTERFAEGHGDGQLIDVATLIRQKLQRRLAEMLETTSLHDLCEEAHTLRATSPAVEKRLGHRYTFHI